MKCLVCTCFDVSSFFGTVENLGWGDVERGQTKIFYPPPYNTEYLYGLQYSEILSTDYSTVLHGGNILSTYYDTVQYGGKIER